MMRRSRPKQWKIQWTFLSSNCLAFAMSIEFVRDKVYYKERKQEAKAHKCRIFSRCAKPEQIIQLRMKRIMIPALLLLLLLWSDDPTSERRKFQSSFKPQPTMDMFSIPWKKGKKWRSLVGAVYRLNFLQANIWHRLGYSNAPQLLPSPPLHRWKDFVFCCCQRWFSGRPDSTTKCVSFVCSLSKLFSVTTLFVKKLSRFSTILKSFHFHWYFSKVFLFHL